MELQGASSSQKDLEVEKQNWKIHTSGFQTYSETIITKTVWFWHEDSPIDQQDRTESPELSSHIYKWSLQQMALGQPEIHMQNKECGPLPLSIYTN